jgi:signal recognition particle GTPase
MSVIFNKVFNKRFENREARVLMLGLDTTGKTTVLYKQKLVDDFTAIPAIGFNVETI